MKKQFQILCLALLFPIIMVAQYDSVNVSEVNKIEGIGFGDVTKQFLAGVFMGGLVTIPSTFLAAGIAEMNNVTGWDGLGYVILGGIAGFTVGNALGVYLAADENKYDANFLFLLVSSSTSLAVSILIANNGGGIYALLFSPPIITVLALNIFNLKENNFEVGFVIKNIPNTNKQYGALNLKYSF